jgi:hypothetical protein
MGSPPPVGDKPNLACLDEPTRPLTGSEATQVLRRHGFMVERVRDDAICAAPPDERMPVSLTNYDRDEATPFVSCGLRRGPIWGWKLDENLDAPPSSPIFSGRKAEFSFANLECSIYPEGDETEVQIRRMQSAVHELVGIARAKRSSS